MEWIIRQRRFGTSVCNVTESKYLKWSYQNFGYSEQNQCFRIRLTLTIAQGFVVYNENELTYLFSKYFIQSTSNCFRHVRCPLFSFYEYNVPHG